MFPVTNQTRLKEGDSRYDNLVNMAKARAERFLELNPSRRNATFILLQWRGNEYRAYAKFRSTQGTSLIAAVFESEF